MDNFRRSGFIALLAVSFALHVTWEFAQAQLFVHVPVTTNWAAALGCLSATAGDMAIVAVSYGAVVLLWKRWDWLRNPSWAQVSMFTLAGLLVTIALERYSIATGRWEYGPAMPIIPLMEVGLSPAAQWILLPPISVWICRHCFRRSAAASRSPRGY